MGSRVKVNLTKGTATDRREGKWGSISEMKKRFLSYLGVKEITRCPLKTRGLEHFRLFPLEDTIANTSIDSIDNDKAKF